MNRKIKLSDTQLAILAHAAARDDLTVLPTPSTLKARGGALQAVLNSLIDRGLVEEQEAADAPEWRRDEEGRRLSLKVSASGLAAIGLGDWEDANVAGEAAGPVAVGESDHVAVAERELHAAGDGDDQPKADRADAVEAGDPPAAARGLRPGSTGAAVFELLRRESGASVAEMMEASGWQSHSVRGFLSGTVKKKLGLEIASARDENGERRYRVA